MRNYISRRRLLQGAGTVGVAGLIGTQPVSADRRDPLDRYIVGVQPGNAAVARSEAAEVYRVLDFGDIGLAVSGWYSESALAGLARNPTVRYIEEEGKMRAIDHTTGEDTGDPSEEQVLPWGIDRVDADVAHHADETGEGSSLAIIDTGIDPEHETLAVAGGAALTDCGGECAEEWDDDHGHGTHCAGTAGALNNEIGVVGVAPATDLYAVKVLDGDGSGTVSDVAAGIEWTADQDIDVGSLSLGGGDSEAIADACTYAHNEGTMLVAAAGNDGPRPRSVSYPAAYDECIAVSAIDTDDDIARFSSRGGEIELAAPGVDVLSSLPDDAYDEWSGTSMACPHVSGAGAQLMANGASNVEAREQLNATAEDIGLDDTEQGNGLVDVAAALEIGQEDDEDGSEEETTAPAIDLFELGDKSNPRWARVQVDWAVSDGDGNLDSVESVLKLDGEVKDRATSDVSGSLADGEHDLRERDGHGETYDVTLTVTDTEGNSTSATKQIAL